MALDLNKALLLPFLSVLALSFPCRAAAAAWPPGRNLSAVAAAAAAAPPPQPWCDAGAGGCRLADLRPELEGTADPGMLGASLATDGGGSPLNQNIAGCGRNGPGQRYTPCPPPQNRPPRCGDYCRTNNMCPC